MGWFGKQVEDAIRTSSRTSKALLGFANDIFEALLNPIVGVPAPNPTPRYIVVGTPECTMAEPLRGFLSPVYPAVDDNVTHRRVRVHRSRSVRSVPIGEKRLLQAHRARVHGFVRLVPSRIDPAPVRRCDRTTLCSNQRYVGGVRGLSSSLVSVASSSFSPWLSFRTSLLIVAALVYGLRWLGILVLTPLMPLLPVFWALDVWPLSQPRRSHAAQPASIQDSCLRDFLLQSFSGIGWQMNLTASADGLFSPVHTDSCSSQRRVSPRL